MCGLQVGAVDRRQGLDTDGLLRSEYLLQVYLQRGAEFRIGLLAVCARSHADGAAGMQDKDARHDVQPLCRSAARACGVLANFQPGASSAGLRLP